MARYDKIHLFRFDNGIEQYDESRVIECGAEPVYHSCNGLAHEIICTACGRQTDIERAGMDAVSEWNTGTVYRSRHEAPLRAQLSK